MHIFGRESRSIRHGLRRLCRRCSKHKSKAEALSTVRLLLKLKSETPSPKYAEVVAPASLERASELAVGTTEMWHSLALQVDPFTLVCSRKPKNANPRPETALDIPIGKGLVQAKGGNPSVGHYHY